MYEGVISKVPYAYDRILTQEYGERALALTDYQGYAVYNIVLLVTFSGPANWVVLYGNLLYMR